MEQFLSGMFLNQIPIFVFGVWGGILLIGLILAITTAAIASRKGRNGFGWFLIGLFTGIVGLAIILVALPKRYYFEEEE
jgi:hypothetical protein